MSFLEEFQANLDSLPNILHKKYALLRDLDKSLQDNQRQNEQRCEQEIEDIRRGVRIADEKVALAVQAYDLVDTHIQQLDQYLKKFDEELRRERENAAMTGVPASSTDGNTKSGKNEGGRGGRKKTRPTASVQTAIAAATAAAAELATSANPTGMDLDLPVDPNEPTYCFCNQVSYGEMVACDNPDCKIEWFHFGCVGLKEQPKGKWFCSSCAATRNRRRGK
ncbi:unnamed protein product [Vicia faba]|uniref:PHD finger protein ING n=1 Tax=Vicia faba TaxID=3906 RepID=A0AAV0ZWE6_VICFA|nr:unnamed protein product [Vicia faba]